MNSKSEDKTYNELMSDLRAAQEVLAKQIEKKVYLYGFLKGEINPSERMHELERQNAELRKKLQAQQSGSLINYGIINFNDNSKKFRLD